MRNASGLSRKRRDAQNEITDWQTQQSDQAMLRDQLSSTRQRKQGGQQPRAKSMERTMIAPGLQPTSVRKLRLATIPISWLGMGQPAPRSTGIGHSPKDRRPARKRR